MSAISANGRRGQRGAKSEILYGHADRLHNLVHELFPIKPAAHLADLTGLSISAWHKNLRERRDFSPGALWSLFRVPHYGSRFLRAFIGDDHRDDWYVELQKQEKLREIENWERSMREIDDQYAAQATAARRHQAVRELGQACARETKTLKDRR